MSDPAVSAVNEIMGRLHPLDTTLANAFAFRALLEDLHGRDLSAVKEPHVSAVHMVRAGILRAAIGTIMAAVDRRGTDRASIGQVIHMLDEVDLAVLADRWPDATFGPAELQRAKDDWDTLLATTDFKDCKGFRDGAIGHTLVLELPSVPNEAYFHVGARVPRAAGATQRGAAAAPACARPCAADSWPERPAPTSARPAAGCAGARVTRGCGGAHRERRRFGPSVGMEPRLPQAQCAPPPRPRLSARLKGAWRCPARQGLRCTGSLRPMYAWMPPYSMAACLPIMTT